MENYVITRFSKTSLVRLCIFCFQTPKYFANLLKTTNMQLVFANKFEMSFSQKLVLAKSPKFVPC